MSRPRNDRKNAFPSPRPLSGPVCRIVVGVIGLLLLGGATPAARAQDRTATWLEDRGMDDLLALHLEQRLDEASGDGSSRSRIAARLAEVYARLLRVESDEDRRDELVERSRRLLNIVKSDDATPLRIALARNRYLNASRTIENGRIELAEEAEVADALEELGRLASELAEVRRTLDDRIERLERSSSRRVERRLDLMLRASATAALLEGWSLYYVGRAREDRDALQRAQLAFGAVLQGDSPVPAVEMVSHDLQSMEGFSRAMLGMGLTTSILVSPRAGRPWLDRLEESQTAPATRQSLPGWRLASLLDADSYPEAAVLLEQLMSPSGSGGDPIPVAWLRLAAVGGLRGMAGGSAEARVLAGAALAALAGQGELAQVRDLADRFGTEALGRDGFAFRYVRGIEAYQEAVEAREAGETDRARVAFTLAVEELRAAIGESDAGAFASARAGCETLVGWSLLELGRWAEAADAFESAAETTSGDRRADAIWGAIVALDRLVSEGGPESADAAARREALTGRFVDAFPADDRAPSLLVRRIAQDENPGLEDLDVLLGVPSTHPTWELARRRAAQMLYRSFRDARSGERAGAGARMLEVADELLLRDRSTTGEFAGADAMLLRQAAEVAAHPEVHDAIRAARYLAQIETAAERGAFPEVPDIVNEAAYRRIGLALGAGDFEEASVRMLAMPVRSDTPEAARWARLASQLVHRMAVDRMRGGEVRVEVARAAVRGGERYLELQTEMLDEPAADRFSVLDRARMLPFAASVAAARDALYRATGRLEDGQQALAWYRAVLERRPLDGSVLEATGDLAEALGETDIALDCWRRLVRGAGEGGETWWKARTAQIRTLLQIDPARAVEVFDQLRALYPELGPEPWRSELLDLQAAVDDARGAPGSARSEDGA